MGGKLGDPARAPDQDIVDVRSGVEFAHVDGLLQEGLRVVACLLGLGEGGDQGVGLRRRAICSYALLRQSRAEGGLVCPALGFGKGATLVVERSHRRGGGLAVGGA
ncbi:hypothetical protein ACFWN1_18820 [Streptomyces sp. NPDC058459]|uniref:hypothetical protein n=1 Tax=Streptomyces sp. NPDC058459 TaxID=3346508 RepID=UPI003652F583